MSKRCELQKEYYKANGNYKGTGKYSDEYVSWLEDEVLALRQPLVVGRSEQLPCSHCGRPLKEHSKDSKLCPDRMKNFEQGN
jgi:hypothetical protein